MHRNLIKIKFVALILSLFLLTPAFAYEDGFGSAKKVVGKHFIIYYSAQLDPYFLLQKLNIGPGDMLLTSQPDEDNDDLASALDTLYARVGNILDMNLYSLQVTLKICRDLDQLRGIHRAMFDKDITTSSFYVNDLSTIYISADYFTKEILGHEIAHTIINHYFAVSPSPKASEILAGYVEYQLRKSSR